MLLCHIKLVLNTCVCFPPVYLYQFNFQTHPETLRELKKAFPPLTRTPEAGREPWGGFSLRASNKESTLLDTPPDALISDFFSPELRENELCCFKPLSLWYFVQTALGNEQPLQDRYQ